MKRRSFLQILAGALPVLAAVRSCNPVMAAPLPAPDAVPSCFVRPLWEWWADQRDVGFHEAHRELLDVDSLLPEDGYVCFTHPSPLRDA